MVKLRKAVMLLFDDILSPVEMDSNFAIQLMKPYWHKELRHLTEEELGFVLASMIHMGVGMTEGERKEWKKRLLEPNPVVVLLKKGA